MSLFISGQASDYKEKCPVSSIRHSPSKGAVRPQIPLEKRISESTRELFTQAEKTCLISDPLSLLLEQPELFLEKDRQGDELRWWLQITNLSSLSLGEREIRTIRAVNEQFPDLFAVVHLPFIPRLPIHSGTSVTFIPKNLLFLEMGRPLTPKETSFASFFQGGNLPLATPEELLDWCELIEETNDPQLIKAFIRAYYHANLEVSAAGLESGFDICKLVHYVRHLMGFRLPNSYDSEKIKLVTDSARSLPTDHYWVSFSFETLTLGFQARDREYENARLPTNSHPELSRLCKKYPYVGGVEIPPPRQIYFNYRSGDDDMYYY